MTTKEIEILINDKKLKIAKLAEEISELTDRLVFEDEKFSEVYDTVRIRTGIKKTDVRVVKVKEGRITWTEDFLDKDTGKFISIERSQIVAINGKRVDLLGRAVKIQAKLIEASSNKKAWDEFPLNQ